MGRVDFACTVVNTPMKKVLSLDCKDVCTVEEDLVKGNGHG